MPLLAFCDVVLLEDEAARRKRFRGMGIDEWLWPEGDSTPALE
jgi:hypothetical protein